jgi:trigger factor
MMNGQAAGTVYHPRRGQEKIKENLTQGYDKRIEQELNEQIFSQILEKIDFEVPDVMVEL